MSEIKDITLNGIEYSLNGGTGLSDEVKQALLACFRHTAFLDEDEDYYSALENALYPPADLQRISCVYTQSGVIYDTYSLDSLKSDLVVTAHYDDSTTQIVTNYTLSGILSEGISVITVSYGGKTDTFDVIVTHEIDYSLNPLSNVTWMDNMEYNASTGVMSSSVGNYCTTKFDVQDIPYAYSSANNSDKNPKLFVWDNEGNFVGSHVPSNNNTHLDISKVQLKPNYKYALQFYNAGTFDASKITMSCVDARSTAINEFIIPVYELVEELATTTISNVYELNVTTILSNAGCVAVRSPDLFTNINRINHFCILHSSGTADALSASSFAINKLVLKPVAWQGDYYFHFYVNGITTLDGMKQYLIENNVTIRGNY